MGRLSLSHYIQPAVAYMQQQLQCSSGTDYSLPSRAVPLSDDSAFAIVRDILCEKLLIVGTDYSVQCAEVVSTTTAKRSEVAVVGVRRL